MLASSRVRITPLTVLLVLAAMSGGPSWAAGQNKKVPAPAQSGQARKTQDLPPEAFKLTPGYVVKTPDVSIPSDVPVGQYRRMIRPFPNWTLICDENLARKQKVCNISQTVIGPDGATVFSWSLAATQQGEPFFILRVPPAVGPTGSIVLDLGDGQSPVTLPVTGCDAHVCVAYQPVGPRLRHAAEASVAVQVSYNTGSPPGEVSFRAPFAGLSDALAAI